MVTGIEGPSSFWPSLPFSFVLEIEPQVLASQALLVNYNPLKFPRLALINLHSPGRPLIHAFLLAFQVAEVIVLKHEVQPWRLSEGISFSPYFKDKETWRAVSQRCPLSLRKQAIE